MNLAVHDIRHNLGRFALTAAGIGLLLMTVLGMSGIYRGMIEDALVVVDHIGADLWVVQRDTRGPFAEVSRLPASLEDRVRAVPGVASARNFVSHTIQREHRGQPLRIAVQGLAWPEDKGEWLRLVAGRPLAQAHFELVADRSLGLKLGEVVPLGREHYTVVGLTSGMVSSGGDGLAFFTVRDALAVQFDVPGEAIRLEREARRARAASADIARVSPELLNRAAGAAANLPVLAPPLVSAVIVRLAPGADPAMVAATLSGWPDVSVHTAGEQRGLLLRGMIDKARRQIGLFRVLLVVISTIIMALIIYTLTLDKVHDIALLKLMGARNRMIIGLILQQALLLGALGYVIAYVVGGWLFPLFPRRVLVAPPDLWALAAVVVAISVFSSLLGIWKALRVEPNKVLS
jgi:putative ABC transport system permease protein